jgi:two-component system response regulator AtoC
MQGPFGLNSLSDEAAASLLSYSWPGNVRELENVMERALVLAGTERIRKDHLPNWISGISFETAMKSAESGFMDLNAIVDSVERHYIRKALASCNGVRSGAAQMLGLKRTTLLARMKRLGIEEEQEGKKSGDKSSQNPGS